MEPDEARERAREPPYGILTGGDGCRRRGAERRERMVALRGKGRHRGSRNGIAWWKIAMLLQRIHEYPVLLQTVMQMRSRREARGTDAADGLALTDRCTGFDAGRECRQVQVVRLVSR